MHGVGAWGYAVFSDDTTSDLRDDYRALLEDQVPDDQAAQAVVDAYRDTLGPDEEHLLWLALAAAQSQVGRLQPEIRDRALEVIESERGLELWVEAGPKALARRRAALQKLSARLTGPQPARKRLRRPWRYVTELEPGDVLRHTSDGSRLTLWRIAHIDEDRTGMYPVVQQLAWDGSPAQSELNALSTLPNLKVKSKPLTCFQIVPDGRRAPDWSDAGFDLVGRTPARAGDGAAAPRHFVRWVDLGESLRAGYNPGIYSKKVDGVLVDFRHGGEGLDLDS